MASMQKTYTGDLTQFIAKKIIAALLKKAKSGKKGIGIEDDDVVGGKSSPINPITSIVPTPKSPLGELQSSENFDKGELGKLARKDPLLKKRLIQQRMRPMGGKPIISAERGFFPRAFSKIFDDGIEVKEKKLGVFLEKVALSLSSSINTINDKMDESNENVIAAKDGIDKTYKKLEQNGDSLEQKLDAIIDALRYSNRSAEEKRDKNEAAAKEAFMQQQVDLSNANRILMQDMDRQEIRDMQAEDLAEDDRGRIQMDQGETFEDDDLPSLARGGIVSGPDSGYLAVLHGDEAVIPLDNNFTQGEPTAVGKEPISQMPMMAERGITPGDNPDNMKPKFSINAPSVNPKLNFGGNTGGGDLAKAIQLPAKMAGIVTGGLMSNVLSTSILPRGVVNHIKSLISPIMESFGVGNLASNLTEGSEEKLAQLQGRQDVLSGGMGKENRERGIFGRLKDFLFGTGGGTMTYRGGTGGNTYINNRSSGTGGYGTGGMFDFLNRKPSDNIDQLRYKSDHPLGTEQPNPFKPGSTLYKNFERMREMDRYGVLDISSSGGDSQFFAKNVTYDNAFDYNKFNSPEHGLNISNVAYNMSMQDEVDSIVDAISNPEEQVVLNNQTANSNSDNQIEYSAIQVRGNPLKQGTYISPYSV